MGLKINHRIKNYYYYYYFYFTVYSHNADKFLIMVILIQLASGYVRQKRCAFSVLKQLVVT